MADSKFSWTGFRWAFFEPVVTLILILPTFLSASIFSILSFRLLIVIFRSLIVLWRLDMTFDWSWSKLIRSCMEGLSTLLVLLLLLLLLVSVLLLVFENDIVYLQMDTCKKFSKSDNFWDLFILIFSLFQLYRNYKKIQIIIINLSLCFISSLCSSKGLSLAARHQGLRGGDLPQGPRVRDLPQGPRREEKRREGDLPQGPRGWGMRQGEDLTRKKEKKYVLVEDKYYWKRKNEIIFWKIFLRVVRSTHTEIVESNQENNRV